MAKKTFDREPTVILFIVFSVPWEGVYKPVVIENRIIDARSHQCSTVKKVPLCCIDEWGMVNYSNPSVVEMNRV